MGEPDYQSYEINPIDANFLHNNYSRLLSGSKGIIIIIAKTQPG